MSEHFILKHPCEITLAVGVPDYHCFWRLQWKGFKRVWNEVDIFNIEMELLVTLKGKKKGFLMQGSLVLVVHVHVLWPIKNQRHIYLNACQEIIRGSKCSGLLEFAIWNNKTHAAIAYWHFFCSELAKILF